MGRTKLKRFEENRERFNILEPGKEIYEKIKGSWNKAFFKNNNPITVELACGRGEYTTGLAALNPHRNFIGVDIKGDRLWKGSTVALAQGLENTAFLRTQILLLDKFFSTDEIDEIWIVFPDPRVKESDERRRLTHPRFLELYKRLVKKGSLIRLKTDNTLLYQYSMELLQSRNDVKIIAHTDNLYESPLLTEHFGIKTRFENMFVAKGECIKYIKFSFVD